MMPMLRSGDHHPATVGMMPKLMGAFSVPEVLPAVGGEQGTHLFVVHAAPLGHSQDSVIDLSNSFSNKKL
jgi:hypothetical protein